MEFSESIEDGPHALLARFVGEYTGRARLWFSPEDDMDTPADDEAITAQIVSVNGGRFVRLTYATRVQGDDHTGAAAIGCHLRPMAWQIAWVDSFHTGTELFSSSGPYRAGEGFDASTTYEVDDGPPWSWRTTIDPTDDGVVLRFFNGAPGAAGDLAVQFDLVRV